MGSKELKTALKAAREAIRNKEFKEALKQCKAALAEDKNNYNALVFVGVAAEGLEQYDQALKAYRRATEISPEQLLAWQGLSSMHVKNPGLIGKEEMVGVYGKLVELYDSDKEKRLDSISKLIGLYGDSDLEKAVSLFERALKDCEPGSGRTDLLLQLLTLLQKQQKLKPYWEEMLYSSLKELLKADDITIQGEQLESFVQTYLNMLRKREPEMLFDQCCQLSSRFPTLPTPMETKLQILLDRQMEKSSPAEVEEMKSFVSSLAQLMADKTSAELFVAQGFLALQDGNCLKAKDFLQQGIAVKPAVFCGYFYLAQVLFRLHCTSECIHTCEEAVSLASSKSRLVAVGVSAALDRLRLLMAQCYLHQGTKQSLSQALSILDEVNDTTDDSVALRASVLLELGEEEKFQECLEKLQHKDAANVRALQARWDYCNKDYSAAVSKLRQCVSEDASNAAYLLRLGQALWELRQAGDGPRVQEECFNSLLKSAKLDPHLSDTFLYLGHFYSELKRDQDRGKKCYQKAFDLDPNNDEAGAALCDMLTTLGDEDSVQSLLLKVTETASAGCAKWAWLRLGLAQVRSGDPSTAIASFQSALRADPEDRHVWECLAEAYLNRGSFTAALKAFGRAAEIHPDSTYCLYQMANIKQRIGILSEAAKEYNLILNKSPSYVPALKGLGETLLMLAQSYLRRSLLGLARDNCQQAMISLTRAATQRPDLSCLWKLLGDCCIVLHSLDSASFRMCVPKRLCQSATRDNSDTIEMGKLELLQLGARCYGRALKILPDSAPLWHDLGISFLCQCRESVPADELKSLAEKCLYALKKAASLDPSNHMHWTALGVVATSSYVKNFALAQHCFIKSIQSEANNAVAWTNLGTLYLQKDNIQLAHEAFKVAQSQDPDYVAGWVGQALIAELVGHEEAMDLFRHTTELGIHLESCTGYGHWVISTLLDVTRQDTEAFQYCIHQMAAIPSAADALTRYTGQVKTDPAAFNMLGLLLEHQGLVRASLQAFQMAVKQLEEAQASGEVQMKIKLNLARLLGKDQKYKEAAAMFESCVACATFADLCQWGLVLYQAGRLQDSSRVYQQALAIATLDADKSNVCAALGMVSYKLGDMEEANSWLFQGFQTATPSLQGLFALCALGLRQGDMTLTQATLQDLSARVQKDDALADVATLTAASGVSQGDVSGAILTVQQLLQDHSNVSGLWLLMARLALLHQKDGLLAETCAREAARHSKPNDKEPLLCLAVSQLSTGKHSRRNAQDNAVSAAQKAFHARPDDIDSLCCLVGAIHSKAVIQFTSSGDTSLLSQEVRLLDLTLTSAKVTSAQRCWCLKQKAVAQIMSGDAGGASQTLQQLAQEVPEEQHFVLVLDCVLKQDQARLEPLVIREGTDLFFWQVLLVGLVKKQQWTEAGIVLREALQKATGDTPEQVKIACLLHIAWIAAHQLLRGGDGSPENGDNNPLLAELEEATQALEQVSQQPNMAVQLLHALVHFHSNPRKAKHHFANVLDPAIPSSSLGVDQSMARRGVIFLLQASQKDPELVQKLLLEAEESGDTATVSFYQRLAGQR